MLKEEDVLQELLKFLDSNNIVVDDINLTTSDKPVFMITIKKIKEGTQDFNTLLTELYKIFWVLTYGKPNDKNKSNKIDIKYRVEE